VIPACYSYCGRQQDAYAIVTSIPEPTFPRKLVRDQRKPRGCGLGDLMTRYWSTSTTRSVDEMSFDAQNHDAVPSAHRLECGVEVASASAPLAIAFDLAGNKERTCLSDESVQAVLRSYLPHIRSRPIDKPFGPFRERERKPVRRWHDTQYPNG
jgi:hypothetical protein